MQLAVYSAALEIAGKKPEKKPAYAQEKAGKRLSQTIKVSTMQLHKKSMKVTMQK